MINQQILEDVWMINGENPGSKTENQRIKLTKMCFLGRIFPINGLMRSKFKHQKMWDKMKYLDGLRKRLFGIATDTDNRNDFPIEQARLVVSGIIMDSDSA